MTRKEWLLERLLPAVAAHAAAALLVRALSRHWRRALPVALLLALAALLFWLSWRAGRLLLAAARRLGRGAARAAGALPHPAYIYGLPARRGRVPRR